MAQFPPDSHCARLSHTLLPERPGAAGTVSPPPEAGDLLLGLAVVVGAVVAVVEVADCPDRAVGVALLAALPEGRWEVRAPPMPKRTTPRAAATRAVSRPEIPAHRRRPLERPAFPGLRTH